MRYIHTRIPQCLYLILGRIHTMRHNRLNIISEHMILLIHLRIVLTVCEPVKYHSHLFFVLVEVRLKRQFIFAGHLPAPLHHFLCASRRKGWCHNIMHPGTFAFPFINQVLRASHRFLRCLYLMPVLFVIGVIFSKITVQAGIYHHFKQNIIRP